MAARKDRTARVHRHELLGEVLEACRVEVVRRLRNRELPTTLAAQHMVVIDNPEGTGWGSEWRQIKVSPLRSTEVLIAIRDEPLAQSLVAFAEELAPLADHLNNTTDLGTRSANFWPALTGVEAILRRYLTPLALHYLQQLRDVRRARPSVIRSLAADLDLLCDPATVIHCSQLPVDGISVRRAVTHRGVTLRPLSPVERGAILEDQASWLMSLTDPGEFIVPRRFEHFAPSALLEAQNSRNRDQTQDESRLAHRVALAFFLSGLDIGSSGILVAFDRPRWAAIGFGMSHAPFPVAEKILAQHRPIEPSLFRAIVDLAYQIPSFGAEGSGPDIVLFRVLRGAGLHWQESGFLDFAIALEAALLGGVKTELAYRFSLYGALFLRDERDPTETFARLKNVYDVRSKLVHGGRVNPEDRTAAERDAADLARAVTRKAVVEGWPDRRLLDAAALEGNQTPAGGSPVA